MEVMLKAVIMEAYSETNTLGGDVWILGAVMCDKQSSSVSQVASLG